MNRTRVRAALALAPLCLAAPAPASETPTGLGTVPGFTIARPRDVGNGGDIVGQAERAGVEPTQQAALWLRRRGGYLVEALPALDGLLRSDARAFSRAGAPVGSSSIAQIQTRAVLWRKDPSGARVPVDLEPPPGFTDAQAFDASASGLVVGEAVNPRETINGSIVRHAVAWLPKAKGGHEVVDLGVPQGWDVSSASGVNEKGEIVGTARRFESDGSGGLFLRAAVVVWRQAGKRHGRCHAEAVVLASHPDLPRNQNPRINNAGYVIAQADRGVSGQPVVNRALLWRRHGQGFAGPDALPVPPGFTDAFPADVNERGVVVGTAQLRQPALTASRAVVWARSKHSGFAPGLLPNPPGVALVTVLGVNDRGDVVGNAPIPTPGTSGGLLWRRAAHPWATLNGEPPGRVLPLEALAPRR